ncbi:sugar ABC transporter permease [Alkalibacterium pelagium]|uniref:Carbohydrate ABC transporter membrane protein 1, CUT1 family n=2 Tax=Alkalibacterium pelagium TaxID=426702 RepID=A0A1H7HHT3_9LACT|nr:ABC transporter permease subunit [Alkalibacterium pelagium]GEN50457.1 sugar ABC transporter permease [Alkalibacterium pelagium]SEK49022.1 carbohydrate ABC transporter membrane protein 1, CUT1 family [Alkalibacterium pelagium]
MEIDSQVPGGETGRIGNNPETGIASAQGAMSVEEYQEKLKRTEVSKFESVRKSLRKDWQLYTFLILPVVYLIVFQYLPMIGNVIAFRRFVPGGSMLGQEFVGLRYFEMFWNDRTFWRVFRNTLTIGGYTLLFNFPIPIIFALLLNEVKSIKFKRFVQTASYLPHFISMVIVAGMIMEMLSASGIVNQVIEWFGGNPTIFLQRAEWFRTIYVGSEIWQRTGWGAILYLAALTNIDPNLYEAAAIDGAGRLKQTWHVTLPGIMPTIITLLILNIGNFMNVGFEKVFLLYNPLTYETGDVISTYLYRIGLGSANFSYATAIGLAQAVIGFILVMGANLLSRKLTNRSLW